jgi:hypothetical protein
MIFWDALASFEAVARMNPPKLSSTLHLQISCSSSFKACLRFPVLNNQHSLIQDISCGMNVLLAD